MATFDISKEQLLMATVDISEDSIVTLKYYFEKQKRLSRNHVV